VRLDLNSIKNAFAFGFSVTVASAPCRQDAYTAAAYRPTRLEERVKSYLFHRALTDLAASTEGAKNIGLINGVIQKQAWRL